MVDNDASDARAFALAAHPPHRTRPALIAVAFASLLGACDHATAVEFGDVGLSIRTTGRDLDLDGYELYLDGTRVRQISSNGSAVVHQLTTGEHTFELRGVADNCSFSSPSLYRVLVEADQRVVIAFELECLATPKIAFEFTVTSPWYVIWIATVNADGSGITMIEPGTTPTWSPDKRYLLWSTSWCDDYYRLYCGGGLSLRDLETGETRQANVVAFGPAWSPQGDAIAYTQCCPPLEDATRLYLLPPLDWSPAESLSFQDVTEIHDVTWSPDGTRLAFRCYRGSAVSICSSKKDGSELNLLTNDQLYRQDLAWSPDGTRIAFTFYQGPPHIGVLTLSTGALADLGPGADPAWSPDASQLVFADADGLFLMNADGSNRMRLTTGMHRAPAWRP